MKEPRWLTELQVLAIHERLLAEHGGLVGIRDNGLLKSALDRPQNLFTYEKPSIFDMAAAYAHGIAKNHPFLDGNKRTALASAGIFLERNGYQLTASEETAVVATLELASGQMNQESFSTWLKQESKKR
jgi:death-on-curing protein